MHRCAAVLLMCLAACGPFFRREEGPPPDRLTLCVENATIAYGNLVVRAGPVRYDVMPGEQVCKPLIGTGGYIPLRAVTTGGGIGGPRRYEERLSIGGYRCWLWRLTDSPASSTDLGPCRDESDDDSAPAPADSVPAGSAAARLSR